MSDCSHCHGTGRCISCRGTGHFGYPGFGSVDRYPDQCNLCHDSGVCRYCRGTGKQS